MMAETVGVNINEYLEQNTENLVSLLARAFLYARGDAKFALARALLYFMN